MIPEVQKGRPLRSLSDFTVSDLSSDVFTRKDEWFVCVININHFCDFCFLNEAHYVCTQNVVEIVHH